MSSIPLRLLSFCIPLLPKVEAFVVCYNSTDRGNTTANADFTFGLVAEDRLDEITRLPRRGDEDRNLARRLFAQGQQCFAAQRDGRIVGYAWLCQRMTMFDAGFVKPQPTDVYCTERVAESAVKSREFDRCFYDALLGCAASQGWQSVYRVVDIRRRHHLGLATRSGWRADGAVVLARGWRSSLPRLALSLGNVYPVRLVQALDSGPSPEPLIGWRELALRSVKRPFQWLRYGVFHLRLLNLLTLSLAWFGESRLIFIYRRDLQKPLAPCTPKVPVEIGWATVADAQEIADLEHEDEARVQLYRNRLERGDRCCVARIDGRIVSTNWIRFGTAWSWTDIKVEDGDIYMTDAYTLPKLRGKGIHPLTNHTMLAWARDQGYRASLSILDATNANSWPVMANLGWDLTGVVIAFKRKGKHRTRYWCVTGSPYPMLIDGTRVPVDPAKPVD
jgi:GNAT superfamily N-acetyltransferase